MPNTPKQNPSGQIPRTPEEFIELAQRMSGEQRKDLLSKTTQSNAKIEDAIKVAQMIEKSEGWPIFAAAITDLREMISGEASIANMQGTVLEKGGKVENLQGRMIVLEYIQEIITEFRKKAREQPVDVVALQKSLEEINNN